jgi:GDP-mannose 6-dehydrogenase
VLLQESSEPFQLSAQPLILCGPEALEVAPDNLVGQNLGYAYSVLPRIDDLMVTRQTAESRDYARIIATNRLIDTLAIDRTKLVDTSAIA